MAILSAVGSIAAVISAVLSGIVLVLLQAFHKKQVEALKQEKDLMTTFTSKNVMEEYDAMKKGLEAAVRRSKSEVNELTGQLEGRTDVEKQLRQAGALALKLAYAFSVPALDGAMLAGWAEWAGVSKEDAGGEAFLAMAKAGFARRGLVTDAQIGRAAAELVTIIGRKRDELVTSEWDSFEADLRAIVGNQPKTS